MAVCLWGLASIHKHREWAFCSVEGGAAPLVPPTVTPPCQWRPCTGRASRRFSSTLLPPIKASFQGIRITSVLSISPLATKGGSNGLLLGIGGPSQAVSSACAGRVTVLGVQCLKGAAYAGREVAEERRYARGEQGQESWTRMGEAATLPTQKKS